MLTRSRVGAVRAVRRWYCSKDWMSEIDADMVKVMEVAEKDSKHQIPKGVEWEGLEAFKEKNLKFDFGDVDFTGKATAKGIELFFERRRIKKVGKWGRQLPGTNLSISPVTHSLKRMNQIDNNHLAAFMRSLESGINAFDVHTNFPDGTKLLYKALEQAVTAGYSRSGMLIIARVGWVQFDHWSEVNCVAPDFSKIPNSREISTYGRDFTLPPITAKNYVKLESTSTSLNPDAIGETMDAKYKFYIPGQPNIDVKKIGEKALFKLAGLITVNKKLCSYWSGAGHIVRSQVETFLSGGLTCADFVIIEAVHIAKAVANSDEEFVQYLTETFEEMEALVKEGKVQYYGVESDRFWGGSDTPDFIDLRLVLQAAKNAGGASHHFRVVSQPFNLTERGSLLSRMADNYPKTVFDFIKENELISLTTRPLATYDYEGKEQRYVDHRRATDVKAMANSVAGGIEMCCGLEQAGARLLENIVLRPSPMLYALGGSLAAASKFLNNYYMFELYMNFWFREISEKCFGQLNDTKDTVIMKWLAQYRKAYGGLEKSFSTFLQNIHAKRDQKILAGIESCIGPDTHLGIELPQMAINSILATNVMQSVSVGLRLNIYVDACVARNPVLLEPLPVSVVGRLFTEPETSFQERRREKSHIVTMTDEIANLTEDEIEKKMKENLEKTGVGSVVHVVDDEGDPLPSWVKVVPEEDGAKNH